MGSKEKDVKADGSTQVNLENRDSFNISSKKSPLMWFAFLQIPIVIGMVIGLYLMYQSSRS